MLIDQTWKNEFINNLLHNKLKRKKKRVPPAIPRNLGIRRYRGTCPPSNPFRTPGPDRDFWPLMPKPQLFPCPAEIPLPFLFPFFLDPGCWPRLSSLNLTPGDVVTTEAAAAAWLMITNGLFFLEWSLRQVKLHALGFNPVKFPCQVKRKTKLITGVF